MKLKEHADAYDQSVASEIERARFDAALATIAYVRTYLAERGGFEITKSQAAEIIKSMFPNHSGLSDKNGFSQYVKAARARIGRSSAQSEAHQ